MFQFHYQRRVQLQQLERKLLANFLVINYFFIHLSSKQSQTFAALSFLAVNLVFWGFGLLAWQKRQTEDITLGLWETVSSIFQISLLYYDKRFLKSK